MSEANNGQDPAHTPAQRKPKRHNAKLCPLVIRERIINALATGDSHRAIARSLRVSPNTVAAVAEEEWKQVDAHKSRIAAQAERAATKAFDLINQKLDSDGEKITVNQLVPVAGVSVDKCLALRGDSALQSLALHEHRHIHANLPPLNSETLAKRREQLRAQTPEDSHPE